MTKKTRKDRLDLPDQKHPQTKDSNLPRSKQNMIPEATNTENPFFQQKDSTPAPDHLDLTVWARELKRKIATSDEQTANLRSQAASLRTRADVLSSMAQQADVEASALRDLLKQIETTDVSIKSASTVFPSENDEGKNAVARIRAHVRIILKAAKRPLGRTEILAQLLQAGISVPGVNPAQRIGKILWAADEFEYREKGYWLVGEPLSEQITPRKRYRAPNRRK